jgi:hypothetical protein
MQEIWKDIIGYEGLYQVSNIGRIKSLGRYKAQGARSPVWYDDMIISANKCRHGYFMVLLHKDGLKTGKLCHRLVGEAFIPNPYSFSQINHKDENKENNSVENLEWCDARYNVNYGTRNIRNSITTGKPVIQMDIDGNAIKTWHSQGVAAKSLGIFQGNISSCCSGRLNETGGYRWKFA